MTVSTIQAVTPCANDKVNLIKNSHFADDDGLASTEYWQTNAQSLPVYWQGGKYSLPLYNREALSQTITIGTAQPFTIHYALWASASHPTPSTYLRVKVENARTQEEVDIVINNKVLFPLQHDSTLRFSPADGDLTITFSNEALNPGRALNLTAIELWIEPV
ncbi:phosphopantothenoylcysteine decarboxylase [Pseudomonas sp. StFLB209]|uniref:hypothetical protein n=1 Tax=Pseudomonas sp. StFLB209 TaxID=1028989 RepID=UPI0004F807B9|nr:hypothetical protein [Pseudomonas sp. StFLB209]BAP42784.1 phosphopantothenoylcysteine decarboxylase [Pseudomonas sp. StFLB209]